MEVKDLPQITQSTESDHVVSSISQKTRLISFKNIFEKISFSSLATKAKTIIGAINELNTDFTQCDDGKFILPGGLKILWGSTDYVLCAPNTSTKIGKITFGTTFSKTPRVVLTNSLGNSVIPFTYEKTKSEISVYAHNIYTDASYGAQFDWIAIGY